MNAKSALDTIKIIRSQLEIGRASTLGQAVPSQSLPYPEHCLTNAELMLQTLDVLLKDEHKFTYLPAAIGMHLFQELEGLKASMPPLESSDGWAGKTPEDAINLLTRLDQLYAFCLQYGIITFGFDSKNAQEQISRLRSFTGKGRSLSKQLESNLVELKNSAAAEFCRASTSLSQTLESAIKEIQAGNERATAAVVTVEAEKQAATERALSISTTLHESQNAVAAIAILKAEADAGALKLAEEKTRLLGDAEAAVRAVQAAETQAKDLVANAKVMEQTIIEAKANAANQLDAISKFYGEIETHKQEMLTIKKESQASYNALKQETDKSVAGFRERTDAIVSMNESLVDQIKDHLRKAVGVTLFTAFDKRRTGVFVGTIIWGTLLFISTVGALSFAIWFVRSLTEVLKDPKTEVPLIFARLVIAAPIAFVIAFCARQYGRERRAGEEYAFKSAISVSLESYRDLLVRMQKENPGVQTEFVQKLMLEVFDNPAKRLYPQAEKGDLDESVPAVLKIIDEAIKKIPGAK